jgi:hypothetical protein
LFLHSGADQEISLSIDSCKSAAFDAFSFTSDLDSPEAFSLSPALATPQRLRAPQEFARRNTPVTTQRERPAKKRVLVVNCFFDDSVEMIRKSLEAGILFCYGLIMDMTTRSLADAAAGSVRPEPADGCETRRHAVRA